jgi:hypothetical protein
VIDLFSKTLLSNDFLPITHLSVLPDLEGRNPFLTKTEVP